MKKFKEEFAEFAFKGNVVDMAVGIVIGAAFGSIVSSLVDDLIMPFFGFLTAGINITDLKWVISPAIVNGGSIIQPEVAIMYGSFIQAVINFFIIALSIFIVIKAFQKARHKKEEAPAEEPAETPADIQLLSEIRDLLKNEAPAEAVEVAKAAAPAEETAAEVSAD